MKILFVVLSKYLREQNNKAQPGCLPTHRRITHWKLILLIPFDTKNKFYTNERYTEHMSVGNG